jgi:NADPH-dependent 2,4-dienoyl-CoA reductase/sulfur reductase-like enzyme
MKKIASDKNKSVLAMTYDVLIVGGGPAGLSAAIELKKQGVKNILVVDREPEAGGMPRMCHHTGFGREDLWRMWQGPKYAKYYRDLAEKMDVEVRTSTTILGWEGLATEKILSFTSPNGVGEITAQTVLLATGVRERPRAARLVPGKRPQGVFTTGSLQRFLYQEHVSVGKRAVIIGAELVSLSALMSLMGAGIKCEMMVTEEASHQIEFPYVVMKWALADIISRTPILTNTRISNIFGQKRVEGIELTHKDGSKKLVECDTVIFTGNWIPEHELARMGRLEINPRTKGPVIDQSFQSSVNSVFVAGNLLRGVETADRCALEGQRAARAIRNVLK